jgi:hypothetical protein
MTSMDAPLHGVGHHRNGEQGERDLNLTSRLVPPSQIREEPAQSQSPVSESFKLCRSVALSTGSDAVESTQGRRFMILDDDRVALFPCCGQLCMAHCPTSVYYCRRMQILFVN